MRFFKKPESLYKVGVFTLGFVYLVVLAWLLYKPNYLWLDEVKYAWMSLNWNWFRSAWYTFPFGLGVLYSIWLNIINNEYSVKLISLIATALSLLFLQKIGKVLAEQFFSRKTKFAQWLRAGTALIIFAMPLFYYTLWHYAVELNQYSVDIALTFALIYWGILLFLDKVDISYFANRAAIVLWFSRPVIYVIASLFATYLFKLCLDFFKSCKPLRLKYVWDYFLNEYMFAGIRVALSWLLLYLIRARIVLGSKYLHAYWHKSMGATFVLKHMDFILKEPFVHTLNLGSLWWVFGILFLIGVIYLIYKRLYFIAIFLVLPALLALTTTYLNKFPWYGRLLSFLTPEIILLVGIGIVALGEVAAYFAKRLLNLKNRTLRTLFIVFFFFIPFIIFATIHRYYLVKQIYKKIYTSAWGNGGLGEVLKKEQIVEDKTPKWILMWGNIGYHYYARCEERACDNVKFFPEAKRGHLIKPVKYYKLVKQELMDNDYHSLWLVSAHLNKTRGNAFKELCELLDKDAQVDVARFTRIRDAAACKVTLTRVK